ncbi:MAG: enoyl-CoA hydratase/isomerase family protein [Acidobacteriota bacterium]
MKLETHGQVNFLRLEHGKANAMDETFLGQLDEQLDKHQATDARGLVFGGTGKIFSAGLNLVEIIELDRDGMRQLMLHLQQSLLRLFALDQPVVAAVNGHAIAGGCLLALQADRLVAPDDGFKMGVSEVALGVGVPATGIAAVQARMGPREASIVLEEGELHGPERARELGMVDELVPREKVLDRALEVADRLASRPRSGARFLKNALRGDTVARLRDQLPGDTEKWLDTWFSDEAQEQLNAAVESLRKR